MRGADRVESFVHAARRLAIACALVAGASSCIYSRILYFNTPSLAAPEVFASRVVRASSRPIPMPKAPVEARLALVDAEHRERFGTLDALLAATRTQAFVVVLDGEIVYERYLGGATERTLLPCFSMSKTFTALLVGCAIDDGLVASTEERLVDFVPELARKPRYPEITLEHLLRMESGIDFTEASVDGAALYYTTDLSSMVRRYDVRWAPGTKYLYGGLGVQLLWDVFEKRLGGRTVSSYFESRLWEELGAESPASWSLDSRDEGVEKLFGGFNATARDLARLGRLFLDGGRVRGRRVVSQDWIVRSLEPDDVAGTIETAEGRVRRAKYQWFLTMNGCCYFTKGYEGQYVFVYAPKNLVFVRFGEEYGGVDWPTLFEEIADQL